MKKAVILLSVFGMLSLTVASAQASRDEYYEYGERYEHNRPYYGGERYGAYKFYGTVEAMPPAGVAGIWRISGREVVVNQNTFIKQEYGRIGVGAYVEVKGSGGNPLVAYELEVKGGAMRPGLAPPMPPPAGAIGGMNFSGPAGSLPPSGAIGSPPPAMAATKLSGSVESLPQVGFMGTWRVAGQDVIVNQSTRIKQENGLISVGSDVEVRGGGTPFIAYEVESKKGPTR